MKNSLISIVITVVFSSCIEGNDQKVETITQSSRKIATREGQLEHMVDSLGLRGLCDSTKWAIYALNCDSVVKFKKKLKDSTKISYSSLDLKLDTFSVRSDTTEFLFRYFYNGVRCDGSLVANALYRGIRYTNSTEENYKMCYVNRPIYFCPGDPNSRYLNMKHPEVIRYINNNRRSLSVWFKAEAERRGILKQ